MSQNTYTNGTPSKQNQADQNARLTNRHIQTLSFLQDVARENKELKARVDELETELSQCSDLHTLGKDTKQRIQRLQDDFNRRLDHNNKVLTQKHKDEIMQLVSSKLDAETQWLQDREQLEALIRSHEEKNAQLTDQLDQLKKHDLKVDVLNQQLDKTIAQVLELKTANERLTTENTRLASENIGLKVDANKLQDCQARQEQLTLELGEAQQKIKEFTFKITQLETELASAKESEAARSSGEEKLWKQIHKLNKEVTGYQKLISEQHQMERGLREELDEMMMQLEGELSERDRMLALIERLQEELRKRDDNIRGEAARKPGEKTEGMKFREFVHLKREVNQLREENDELRSADKSKPLALPSLKVASPGGDSNMERRSRGNRHSATSSKSTILSIANIR
ncbi:myosin-4-like [Acanthaster planci]|uniref:Myosin-4-like n=1 Tax=Acanthaster planci TaxID=133434 RepID=A0A8B7YFF6_ACAPL|nr:myosin-4-like [Acanthaster planci]